MSLLTPVRFELLLAAHAACGCASLADRIAHPEGEALLPARTLLELERGIGLVPGSTPCGRSSNIAPITPRMAVSAFAKGASATMPASMSRSCGSANKAVLAPSDTPNRKTGSGNSPAARRDRTTAATSPASRVP